MPASRSDSLVKRQRGDGVDPARQRQVDRVDQEVVGRAAGPAVDRPGRHVDQRAEVVQWT